MLEAQIVGPKPAHRGARQDGELTLWPDREVLHQEVPNVANDVILKTPRLGIQVEAARVKDRRRSRDAAVRGRDDEGRQLPTNHFAVEVLHHAQEKLLVLEDAVQQYHHRVGSLRVKTRRQVDVEVALLAQVWRVDAMVGAVIMREVEDGAADAVIEMLKADPRTRPQ